VKLISGIILLGALVFAFQNCGETARNTGILQQSQTLFQAENCPEGQCVSAAETLWMVIREFDPYRIDITSLNAGHFNVSGMCGTGNFAQHSFIWEMRQGFGNQQVVGRGVVDNRCVTGRFSVPIGPNIAVDSNGDLIQIFADQRYTVTIELVGVTLSNEEVSNPMPNNQGTLDVIFTSTPPN
jgi:hypothetical protein